MAGGCPVVAAQWQGTSQVTGFFLHFTLFSSSSPHNICVNLSLHYQQCYIIALRRHKFTLIFTAKVAFAECMLLLCPLVVSGVQGVSLSAVEHTTTDAIGVASVVPCTLLKRHLYAGIQHVFSQFSILPLPVCTE